MIGDQIEFDVSLRESGPNKSQVIRAVRELTGLGLREAEEIIDCVPCFVVSGVSLGRAKEAQAFLEDVGALVDIR